MGQKYYFTQEHEWFFIDNDTVTVGISDYAVEQLGDISFLEVDSLNEQLESDEVFGTIETVKSVSDLFMPLSGEIIEYNNELEDNLDWLKDSTYDKAWIVKVKPSNDVDTSKYMDEEQYKAFINQ